MKSAAVIKFSVFISLGLSIPLPTSAEDFFIVHTKDGSHVRYYMSDVDSITYGSEKEVGLVAYYPFTGNSRDASGKGNHGISFEALMTEDRYGKKDAAFQFDGKDDFFEVADDPSLDFGQDSDFSVILWVKTEAQIGSFISKYRSIPSRGGFTISMAESDPGKPYFDGRDRTGARFSGLGKSNISDGNWHMLVGMRKSSFWSIWVDSVLENSVDAQSTTAVDNDTPLIIGCLMDVNVKYNFIKAAIDDIRIYNRALSAEEIRALYEE